MSMEAAVSLGAAWLARSPALLAFGGDSAVELLSAAVVFWRFSSPSRREHGEERAGKIAGGLLFVLAAFVVTTSVLTLAEHVEARPSLIGIALLVLAAMIMAWLAARKEHFAALPYAQAPGFITALAKSNVNTSIKLAFEFLILTASRTSEVLLARWSEMDIEKKLWIVPADRMKAKEEHRVPLSAKCLEIIKAAKQISDSGEYIFPGRSPHQPLSNMSFLMALRRMGRGNITAHGFRSSFRDWAEEKTNFANSVIEASLAHAVKNKVEAAYLRTTLLDKRRDLMRVWAKFVTAKPSSKA